VQGSIENSYYTVLHRQRYRMPPLIPNLQDNPDGLHKRYIITKANGEPVDDNALYFVLRLDLYGDDIYHIMACRHAARQWANMILQQRNTKHLHKVASELLQLLQESNIGTDNATTNSQTES